MFRERYNSNTVHTFTLDEPKEDGEELNPFSFKEFIRSKNQHPSIIDPVEVLQYYKPTFLMDLAHSAVCESESISENA